MRGRASSAGACFRRSSRWARGTRDWPSASAAESYAIAMHGAPALPADFSHMPYANPDAPKGGRLVQGILGTSTASTP